MNEEVGRATRTKEDYRVMWSGDDTNLVENEEGVDLRTSPRKRGHNMESRSGMMPPHRDAWRHWGTRSGVKWRVVMATVVPLESGLMYSDLIPRVSWAGCSLEPLPHSPSGGHPECFVLASRDVRSMVLE